jgi:RNA polymerase sigma-70 factor (ECF subfamily)
MKDEDLALLVQKGEEDAFGELMDRYTSKLTRYGGRFLARTEHIEDIVQDVFIKTYQNIQSFDATRKFSSWIYRIAHNTFVNALRKQSTEPLIDLDFDTLLSYTVFENPVEKKKEEEEMGVLVRKGIERLSVAYREVVTLYYFEELSYQEISDILEIPTGTVAIRLSRAKALLKKDLLENNHE